MKYKAIFFDIDGTLVPFGMHEVPASTREAIARIREKGVKVFICTGRHIEWIDNIGDMEVDGYVTVNGAMCTLADKKTVIFTRPIPDGDLQRLVSCGEQSGLVYVVVPKEGGIFINHTNRFVDDSRKLLRLPPIPEKPLESALGHEIVQMMAFGPKELRGESQQLFTEILTDCEPTSWNPLFCDIVPKGSDKGVGMRKMMEHFGIPMEASVAFGDGDNDIAMLRAAGVGVAMGNAPQSVKDAADMVTDDVTCDGVAKALGKLF